MTLTKSKTPFDILFDGVNKKWQHKHYPAAIGKLKSFTEYLSGGGVTTTFEVPDGSTLLEESNWVDIPHFLSQMQLMDEPIVAKVDMSRYPHTCPRCGCHAYVGAGGGNAIDCLNVDCVTKKR